VFGAWAGGPSRSIWLLQLASRSRLQALIKEMLVR